MQASMTGHLVIATLHTSGVEETVLRMKELGAEKSELDAVLKEIIFQSLEFEGKKPVLKSSVIWTAVKKEQEEDNEN